MSEDITKRLADISEMMMEGQPFNDGQASWAWSQPCICDRLRQEEYGPSALTMRALELEAIRVRAMVKGGKITPDTEDE